MVVAREVTKATKLKADQLSMLYGGMPLAILLNAIIGSLFFYIQIDQTDIEISVGWMIGLILVLIGRSLLARAYKNCPTKMAAQESWMAWLRLGSLMTGVTWGFAGILFYSAEITEYQLFTIMVVVGLTAGALTVLAADFYSYFSYSVTALLPPAITSVISGDDTHIVIGSLLVGMLLFLLRAAKRLNISYMDSLALRYENEDLVTNLEIEKKRLDNRLDKILDSTPIAVWAIDTQGIFTHMDMNGISPENIQLSSIKTGDNLFLACRAYPALISSAQRALSGETFHSDIMIDNLTLEVHYSPQLSYGNISGSIGIAVDITERKRHEKELFTQANYDPLTGLSNKYRMLGKMQQAFGRARHNHTTIALMLLDLDNFKNINDTLGHNAGDNLLIEASKRINKTINKNDLASRFSGDEFLVMIENVKHMEEIETIAQELLDIFNAPFLIANREIFISTSMGICVYPQDGTVPEQLLQFVDTALYRAKARGRNQYQFFTTQMRKEVEERLTIESYLRKALENNELEVVYQPKINPESGQIEGAEALLRWHNAQLGTVPPDKFIPVAEDAGLLEPIGKFVLTTACTEAQHWQTLTSQPISIAVNASPVQFNCGRFINTIDQVLESTGLSPHLLEIEITENLLIQDIPANMNMLNALCERDISLALDDFGTGYSSLSYLQKFPLKTLKIDRAFIVDLNKNATANQLVSTIVAMARGLNLKIVAEGVETIEQLVFLKQQKVELIQGYYYSKPVDTDKFRQLLTNSSPWTKKPPGLTVLEKPKLGKSEHGKMKQF